MGCRILIRGRVSTSNFRSRLPHYVCLHSLRLKKVMCPRVRRVHVAARRKAGTSESEKRNGNLLSSVPHQTAFDLLNYKLSATFVQHVLIFAHRYAVEMARKGARASCCASSVRRLVMCPWACPSALLACEARQFESCSWLVWCCRSS